MGATTFYLLEKEREQRAKAEKRNKKGHASEAEQESTRTQTEEQSEKSSEKTVKQLRALAKDQGVKGYSRMDRDALLEKVNTDEL